MRATFIVTSCIKNQPGRGVFSHEERYNMTFDTFESIRKYAPGSKIVLADASIQPLPSDWARSLKEQVDVAIHFNDHPLVQLLSKAGQQSRAETELMTTALNYLRMKMFPDLDADRYFKITGRCCLDEGFNLSQYKNNDNFVYKKRVTSWMNPNLSLLDTRLWSVGSKYLSDAIVMFEQIAPVTRQGFDLEHATMACIPQNKLTEFDRVFAKGRVASDGTWRYD
jgi:hypothetical protein